MLKKIVIENFLSIRDKVEIDFTKTSYTILPQNVNEDKILKGAIFVGANASGKTNVLEAISFLQRIFFAEWKDGQIFLPFCLFGKGRYYKMEYHFLIEEKAVVYKIEADCKKELLKENLIVNNQSLFDRSGKTAISYINDKAGITYTDEVPDDASFLRTIYFNTKFSGNKVLSSWMDFLKKSEFCNLYAGVRFADKEEMVSLNKYLETEGVEKINQFFQRYNFEQEIEYSKESKGKHYQLNAKEKEVFFRRKCIDDPIPMSIESLGNQTLVKLLPIYLKIIEEGGMLIIDEFSSGFHNDLEELLVRHFMKHSKNSQLFLVSHSTNLLKNSVFRPDQEYSVYFDGANGSILKRFSEEQPRNAQNIEKMYNSGVFGGLPNYEVTENEDK